MKWIEGSYESIVHIKWIVVHTGLLLTESRHEVDIMIPHEAEPKDLPETMGLRYLRELQNNISD